jgi:hypothetical protein
MHKVGSLLVSLVCISHGRRVQTTLPGDYLQSEFGMDAFANLLFAQTPAFVRGRSRTATNSLGQHAEALTSRTRFGARLPVMEDDFYDRLVTNCIEDGCSTESVEYLVSALKAKKDLTKEEKEMITELEKLVVKPEDNKNAIQKLLGKVASVFSVTQKPYSAAAFKPSPVSKLKAAQSCLDGGCSVDTVGELLAVLKADEDPDAQVSQTIAQLEKLLGEPEANKNDIQKVIEAAASIFAEAASSFSVAKSEGSGLGYTGEPSKKIIYGDMVFKPSPVSKMQIAQDCLDAGCPVDTVEELLATLKTIDNSDLEVSATINDLEKLLVDPAANKNAIQSAVEGVANSASLAAYFAKELSATLEKAD